MEQKKVSKYANGMEIKRIRKPTSKEKKEILSLMGGSRGYHCHNNDSYLYDIVS